MIATVGRRAVTVTNSCLLLEQILTRFEPPVRSRGLGLRTPSHPSAIEHKEKAVMIVLGIILLVLGYLLNISILTTIGIIVLIVGLLFLLLGATGRAVGGRRYWY